MEEFYQVELERQKKIKQDYLRKNIIEANYDPNEFFEFMNGEKNDGTNVDNWSLDDLETLVQIFKKQALTKPPEDTLRHLLLDIDVEEGEDTIYCRRIPSSQKQVSFFQGKNVYVMVESLSLVDVGFLGAKAFEFLICIPSEGLKVTRSERNFKWLQEMLNLEFPFAVHPPFILQYDKVFDETTVKVNKIFCEKYLNELLKHDLLKNSRAVEIFFTEQDPKAFDKRRKELRSLLQNSLLRSLIGKKPSDSDKKLD